MAGAAPARATKLPTGSDAVTGEIRTTRHRADASVQTITIQWTRHYGPGPTLPRELLTTAINGALGELAVRTSRPGATQTRVDNRSWTLRGPKDKRTLTLQHTVHGRNHSAAARAISSRVVEIIASHREDIRAWAKRTGNERSRARAEAGR